MSESGLTYLSNKNKYERDNRIRFEDLGHSYFIDGVKCDKDKGWTSCTSLVHGQFPHFNPDLTVNRMMKSKNWPNSKYYGMDKKAILKQWDDAGLISRELGTKMHLMIEQVYNEDSPNNIDVSGIESEETIFNKFYDEHKNLIPHRTEMLVFDEELKLTGSIDMIFENEDGTLSIYDWKRSKSIDMKNKYGKSKVFELSSML